MSVSCLFHFLGIWEAGSQNWVGGFRGAGFAGWIQASFATDSDGNAWKWPQEEDTSGVRSSGCTTSKTGEVILKVLLILFLHSHLELSKIISVILKVICVLDLPVRFGPLTFTRDIWLTLKFHSMNFLCFPLD